MVHTKYRAMIFEEKRVLTEIQLHVNKKSMNFLIRRKNCNKTEIFTIQCNEYAEERCFSVCVFFVKRLIKTYKATGLLLNKITLITSIEISIIKMLIY